MDFFGKIHPLIVHFPITILFFYTIIEVMAFFIKNENLDKITFILLGAGIIFSLAALFTGFNAVGLNKNYIGPYQNSYINLHRTLAIATGTYFLLIFIIKLYIVKKKIVLKQIKYGFIALVIIGNILIYLTGSSGGELVFKFGLGTEMIKPNK